MPNYHSPTPRLNHSTFGSSINTRSYSAGSGFRFGFNTQEKDKEIYFNNETYTAKFWEYDGRLGRRWNVDPKANEFPYYSTYLVFGDNPERNIDADGRKFINFDKDGNYTGTSKDNWWHNFWHGSKGRVLNDDRSVQQKFKFSDPENDVADIQSGKIKRLEFVKDKDIQKMVSNSGGFDANNKTENRSWSNRYGYIKEEGKGGGKMDFSYTQIQKVYPVASSDPLDPSAPTPMIFLVDGIAHNHMNFGNFLYGASGEAMGFNLLELRAGAHYNSKFNSTSNGYKSQWDSSDDQFSIKRGFKFAEDRNYHKKQLSKIVGLLKSE